MAFPDTSLEIRVEFRFDGATWTDVTSDILDQTVRLSRGRDNEGGLASPASLDFELDNLSGDYTPDQPMSPYFPHIQRGVRCRFSVRRDVTWHVRFVGDVASWTPDWPWGDTSSGTTPAESRVTVTAAGMLRRLQQGDKPLPSALRRWVLSEAEGTVRAYWPLENHQEADAFESPVAGVSPMGFTGEVSPSSDDSLPASLSLPTGATPWAMDARVPNHTTGASWRVSWVMKLPQAPTSNAGLMRVSARGAATAAGVPIHLRVAALTGGTFSLRFVNSETGTTLGTEQTATGVFGEWILMRLRASQIGGSTRATLTWRNLDGTITGSLTEDLLAADLGRVARVWPKSSGNWPDPVSIGHIWVESPAATTATEVNDAFAAFGGELAADRFLRLCAENNVAASLIGSAADTPPMGPQKPSPLVELLTETVEVDQGMLFERRDDIGLILRTRASMIDQAAALTLDAALNEIREPFTPVLDDQSLRNVVTAHRPDGSEVTASDDASIARDGIYDESVDVNVETDDQLYDQAGWRLHLAIWPEMRYPTTSPDLRLAPVRIDDWLLVELGDRVRVQNLPDQHPPDDVDQLIQGWTEQFSPTDWAVELNTSPAGPFDVGVTIDDAGTLQTDYARLDTSGSVLRDAITSSATSVTVSILNDGDGWTTAAGDMPFYVKFGGEIARITAASTYTAGDPVQGAAQRDISFSTANHVCPSVNAPSANGLLICVAESAFIIGNYTKPAPMTLHAETDGTHTTLADAYQTLAASGGTGTRTFVFSAVDGSATASVVMNGSITTQQRLSASDTGGSPGGDPNDLTFITMAAEIGWWMIVIQAFGIDFADTMSAPNADDTWQLVADSGRNNSVGRIQIWAKRVTDPGAQTVTILAAEDINDIHGRLYLLSGVTDNSQTLTVARSTNGVVKAHTAQTPVELVQPLRLV